MKRGLHDEAANYADSRMAEHLAYLRGDEKTKQRIALKKPRLHGKLAGIGSIPKL